MPRTLLCTVAVLALAPAASADLSLLGASHDNTLYQTSDGSLSNGAGPTMFAGRTAQNLSRRALIQFDLSAIPAGAVITSATLQLNASQVSSTTASTVSLYRSLASWGEGSSNAGASGGGGAPSTPGDATWIHTFYNTSLWTTAGGDFAPVPSASASVAGLGFYTWSGPGLLADVQSWYATPASNFGWEILGNETGPGTSKRFDTRENPLPEFRPVLAVEYSIPAPGAASLLAFAAFTARRRR